MTFMVFAPNSFGCMTLANSLNFSAFSIELLLFIRDIFLLLYLLALTIGSWYIFVSWRQEKHKIKIIPTFMRKISVFIFSSKLRRTKYSFPQVFPM